ncbi:hypothetical protein NVP2044O_47 [Vibrio phage 2.044.O._10N.261.51.B8]|nr:hypothetical protein NVP2044O_47 [Vibrio phage 2.044.O._10N.261.51.B8]
MAIKLEQLLDLSNLELNIKLATVIGRYKGVVGHWAPDSVKLADPEMGFLYSEVNFTKDMGETLTLVCQAGLNIINISSGSIPDYTVTDGYWYHGNMIADDTFEVNNEQSLNRRIVMALIIKLENSNETL